MSLIFDFVVIVHNYDSRNKTPADYYGLASIPMF